MKKEQSGRNGRFLGKPWHKWALLAVCLCLVLAAALVLPPALRKETEAERLQLGEKERAYALAAAVYPERTAYPDPAEYDNGREEAYQEKWEIWWEEQRARRERTVENRQDLLPFFTRSASQFLAETEGENRVYSPLNLYMALAMLAEVTDGESRQQILDVLGAGDLEALRRQAESLWNMHYRADGLTTCVLANSLWLDEDIPYTQATMDRLAQYYYASAFQGEMGAEDYNQALREWINRQTGGLLAEQAEGLQLPEDTLLALASTIYFKAGWDAEFSEGNTEEDTFYSPQGEILCDFMRQSDTAMYYWGDRFSAVGKSFEENGGCLWFVLPDEGTSPEELLADGQALDFLLAGNQWKNQTRRIVHLSVPKFDVSSDLDLIPGLKELGIRDVFDGTVSDFSPITEDPAAGGAELSQAQHAARVSIDEEGCQAAAYTVLMLAGGAMPPEEEVDFVLDRPFLFGITGEDGLPLFIGIVNQPA